MCIIGRGGGFTGGIGSEYIDSIFETPFLNVAIR